MNKRLLYSVVYPLLLQVFICTNALARVCVYVCACARSALICLQVTAHACPSCSLTSTNSVEKYKKCNAFGTREFFGETPPEGPKKLTKKIFGETKWRTYGEVRKRIFLLIVIYMSPFARSELFYCWASYARKLMKHFFPTARGCASLVLCLT